MKRLTGSIVAIAGAAMLITLAVIPAAGQVPAGRGLPRTADGKPDFSGIWEVMSKANYNIEPHSASRGVPAGAGVVEGRKKGRRLRQ